jgi:Flp pilus assembly protein TadG
MTRRIRQRGNVTVEMALAFAILIPVFVGVVRFGMACFYFSELQNAVRAGARFGSYRTYNSASNIPAADWETAVKNTTVYGSPETGSRPVAPGLTPENVSVSVTFDRNVPDQVKVGITNYRMNLLVASIVINKPASEFPYVGRYAPPE